MFGNENATRVRDVGRVVDALEEERNRVYVDGKSAMAIEVFKQSRTNTVALAERVNKIIPQLNAELKSIDPSLELSLIRDGSREISLNIADVQESIFLGILLTIVVVFLFSATFVQPLLPVWLCLIRY